LLALATSCGTLIGLSKSEQPATLILGGEITPITAPDTVGQGSAFQVRFTSYENKCTDADREQLDVRSDSILIHSFVDRPDQCGDALVLFPHSVNVQINTPGRFRIYVYGQIDGSGVARDTVLTRDLVVR
jgi:hypothetical protein